MIYLDIKFIVFLFGHEFDERNTKPIIIRRKNVNLMS